MSDESDDRYSDECVTSPIPLINEHLESATTTKGDVISMLDELESHVEKIRRRAFQIEEERDAMFSTLQAFRQSRIVEDLGDDDRDDVFRNIDRVYAHCSTIDVCVRTVRDEPQEEALHKINGLIDGLIAELHNDPAASKAKCLTYMNLCSPFSENGVDEKNFGQVILGCTSDDRKRVRRRLQGLMNYIEKLSLTM